MKLAFVNLRCLRGPIILCLTLVSLPCELTILLLFTPLLTLGVMAGSSFCSKFNCRTGCSTLITLFLWGTPKLILHAGYPRSNSFCTEFGLMQI